MGHFQTRKEHAIVYRLRISDELWARLKAEAERHGVTPRQYALAALLAAAGHPPGEAQPPRFDRAGGGTSTIPQHPPSG